MIQKLLIILLNLLTLQCDKSARVDGVRVAILLFLVLALLGEQFSRSVREVVG